MSYCDKMSDDENLANAECYFSIGHEGESGKEKHWCWIWDGQKIIKVKGGTHGINFTHDVADRNFKGWYDINKNMISVIFPSYELRKLGDRKPTEDDIPQLLYQKLINVFGKRKPQIVVFENKIFTESFNLSPNIDRECGRLSEFIASLFLPYFKTRISNVKTKQDKDIVKYNEC